MHVDVGIAPRTDKAGPPGDSSMQIAIIGPGVGPGMTDALRRAGNQVTFGVTTPDPAQPDQVPIAHAAVLASMVILATPLARDYAQSFDDIRQTLGSMGDLAGKILIDATNPLGQAALGISIGLHTSVAEEIASMAKGARVYKTFTRTGFEKAVDSSVDDTVMLVVGDDPQGKAAVLSLVAVLGFEAADGGPLVTARMLEGYGMGFGELAFAFLPRA
jgi:predicted dinucleotide-binding enzyme